MTKVPLALITLSPVVLMACAPGPTPQDAARPSPTASGSAAASLAQETQDSVIDTLSFENGFPSKDTATKLYDEMDFQRACQAYLWAFPAVSNQSIQLGLFRDLGADFNDIVVFENFLDTKSLFLTGNTTTIYALALVNLAKDGPVVIEIPPGRPREVNRELVVPNPKEQPT
jgi:hypothetical protein